MKKNEKRKDAEENKVISHTLRRLYRPPDGRCCHHSFSFCDGIGRSGGESSRWFADGFQLPMVGEGGGDCHSWGDVLLAVEEEG